MTIFVVLMQSPQPKLAEAIRTSFANDHLPLTETQYLISAVGTVQEVVAKLGIYDPKNPAATPTGIAVVFATSSYFGRGQTSLWDWLRTKLEAPSSGY